jgi:hypothetical protein
MKGYSMMLLTQHARKYTQMACIVFTLLVMIGVTTAFSPHALAAPTSYGGPSLRLPWLYGNYNISGNTYNCGDHTDKDQFAIDFGLPSGTQVTAVFSGTVHYGSYDGSGYGNNLWVTSSNGYRAVYAHLSSFKVSDGQSVSQGQVVALSGNTGNSTGSHLHFSVRYGGTGSYDGTAQVPEPMSGYTGFGNQSSCVPNHGSWYNPSPGGWWIGPTPSDYTVISSGSQVQVNFRMSDNNNSGLDHGDITYWNSSSNSWQKASNVKMTDNGNGTADVYVVLTMPSAYLEVSVNVYSHNGSYQLAPSGIRHFCPSGSCSANHFPSGGSNTGGSGSGGLNATTFEDFSNGIGAWWTNGNVASTTDGPNTFMRFTPAAQSAAEASKDVEVPALAAYNTIMAQINLHGATLLGNDASALYLDQNGGWKYVSLSNYVQQGLDGWQTVTVSLGDFQDFDQTSSFDRLGFRFWVSSASTVDVGTILFSLRGTATQPFTVYDESLAANWGDWSWCSNNNLADTSHPNTGSNDLSWTVTCQWGGLALHLPSGFDTSTYAAFTFALRASQAGQTVQVSFYDSSGNTGSPVQFDSYGGTPIAGSYTTYTIPITAFQSTGTITGVLIQDISGNSTELAMYVDTMMFQ